MSLHFLDGSEPGAAGVRRLVDRALALESGATPELRPDRRVVALFLNPSLRTRTSMEAACGRLGIQPIILQPGTDAWALEFADGAVMNGLTVEHVKDAVGVLSGYADALAVRCFAGMVDPEEDRQDRVLNAFVAYSQVPVINMESARWHPLQGLADAATWTHHLGRDLTQVPLCLTWAPHPKALPTAVPNQVLLTAALMGMDVRVAHPEGFDLDPQVLHRAADLAGRHGGSVRLTHDRTHALGGARVVVAKSWGGWSGYGRREEEAEHRSGLGHWRMDEASMDLTDRAGFMHCLPMRRNVVATDGLVDGPRSWTLQTAHRRMWTAQALLETILGPEVSWNG